ncbi:MAG: ribonuclease P protein component [Dehalococcoidia bacterium]|nr:ribonuclease P protein component [Dehalococcoidia bacterium]
MRRAQRLTKSKDFTTVHKKGRSVADRLLVLRFMENRLARNRYGFVVSRRVGKAVVRNRVRRRLREAIRAEGLKGGWDVVVIARAGAAEADYQALRRSLVRLVEKGGLKESRVSAKEVREE